MAHDFIDIRHNAFHDDRRFLGTHLLEQLGESCFAAIFILLRGRVVFSGDQIIGSYTYSDTI